MRLQSYLIGNIRIYVVYIWKICYDVRNLLIIGSQAKGFEKLYLNISSINLKRSYVSNN